MIFKKFDSTDIVVGRVNQVSSPMWTSGDIAALQSAFYTSPTQTVATGSGVFNVYNGCLLYTSPSPRDGLLSRMPSSA